MIYNYYSWKRIRGCRQLSYQVTDAIIDIPNENITENVNAFTQYDGWKRIHFFTDRHEVQHTRVHIPAFQLHPTSHRPQTASPFDE